MINHVINRATFVCFTHPSVSIDISISFNIIQYHPISFNIIQYHSISFNINHKSNSDCGSKPPYLLNKKKHSNPHFSWLDMMKYQFSIGKILPFPQKFLEPRYSHSQPFPFPAEKWHQNAGRGPSGRYLCSLAIVWDVGA